MSWLSNDAYEGVQFSTNPRGILTFSGSVDGDSISTPEEERKREKASNSKFMRDQVAVPSEVTILVSLLDSPDVLRIQISNMNILNDDVTDTANES